MFSTLKKIKLVAYKNSFVVVVNAALVVFSPDME
jgi:hypothetical protein